MNSVTDDFDAWSIAPDGAAFPMEILARWWRGDPWAVELTIPSGHHDVVWLIGRELLRDGLLGRAGEGDVQVYPADPHRIDRTALVLSSPNGRAVIELDECALSAFLAATYDAVPAGEELLWVPLDQELTELLDGSEL